MTRAMTAILLALLLAALGCGFAQRTPCSDAYDGLARLELQHYDLAQPWHGGSRAERRERFERITDVKHQRAMREFRHSIASQSAFYQSFIASNCGSAAEPAR